MGGLKSGINTFGIFDSFESAAIGVGFNNSSKAVRVSGSKVATRFASWPSCVTSSLRVSGVSRDSSSSRGLIIIVSLYLFRGGTGSEGERVTGLEHVLGPDAHVLSLLFKAAPKEGVKLLERGCFSDSAIGWFRKASVSRITSR